MFVSTDDEPPDISDVTVMLEVEQELARCLSAAERFGKFLTSEAVTTLNPLVSYKTVYTCACIGHDTASQTSVMTCSLYPRPLIVHTHELCNVSISSK